MMSLGELSQNLEKLDGWALEGSAITKDYSFHDFKEISDFISKIAELIGSENYRPDIMITENNIRVSLTTSREIGVTDRDFVIADKIDQILKN